MDSWGSRRFWRTAIGDGHGGTGGSTIPVPLRPNPPNYSGGGGGGGGGQNASVKMISDGGSNFRQNQNWAMGPFLGSEKFVWAALQLK